MKKRAAPFDAKDFLAKVGGGRTISKYRKNQKLFSQGDATDSVFYIQKGKVKVSVVSEHGKEAVVAIIGKDEFCGESVPHGTEVASRNRIRNYGMRSHANRETGPCPRVA